MPRPPWPLLWTPALLCHRLPSSSYSRFLHKGHESGP
uniref:Uncharacterized protein n=1 Tax=Arundo donax TaxID=35708 RepID=A0A0A9H4B3_ARUDO